MFKAVSNPVTSVKSLIFEAHKDAVTETLHVHSEDPEEIHPAECLEQIERLVGSPLLQGSEALCRLLQYLAHHTLEFPGDHLKEYQIATQVLGRTTDFDPQSDASVRVQVGRLRSKLAEYYNSIGRHDPIVVDIPRGRYTLTFESRAAAPEPEVVSEPVPAPAVPQPPPSRPRSVVPLILIASLLLACGFLVYFLRSEVRTAARPNAAEHGMPVGLQTFWKPFLHGLSEPYVVFSNAIFVGDANSGMRYFEPSKDSRDQITQHYTGVGEVMGVFQLERTFREFGKEFRLKRGGLFTLDDAHNNNLIFVGSPLENLTLEEIPNTQEFTFRWRTAGRNRKEEVIADLHPAPGAPSTYPSGPQASPMNEDYAVVALIHGLDRSQWTLILAGTTTIGTQAAVGYVCDEGSVEDLLRRLHIKSGAAMRPFEALLRVRVANDVPLETQLVTLRPTR